MVLWSVALYIPNGCSIFWSYRGWNDVSVRSCCCEISNLFLKEIFLTDILQHLFRAWFRWRSIFHVKERRNILTLQFFGERHSWSPYHHLEARIITWSYNENVGHFLSSTSVNSVKDHAKSLSNDINEMRQFSAIFKRPIIFIVHNLDDIICAQMNCSFRTIVSLLTTCDRVYCKLLSKILTMQKNWSITSML